MKTILAIFGALVLAVFVYFIGVSQGWWKNIFKKTTPDGTPNACDPTRTGYRKDGVKDSYCGQVPCDPNKYGYDMDGFPDTNCGFGRMAQTRDITRELQIVRNAEAEISNQRNTTAGKISFINKRLRQNGIQDIIVVETGTNPPSGFRLCACQGGQYEIINFWQWAFAGGCGGLSIGGSPCTTA